MIPYQYVLSTAGWVNYIFTAPAEGSISFCWDNSYSYFNKYTSFSVLIRKTVKIELYLIEEQIPANMNIQYSTEVGTMKLHVWIPLDSKD